MTTRARTIIEAMAGPVVHRAGLGREPSWPRRRRRADEELAFAHIFAGKSHEPAIALAEKLKEVAPFPVGKVFFANSGSEANDTPDQALLVRQQCARPPTKKKIIAPHQGLSRRHHRRGQPDRAARQSPSFDLPLDFARHADCPHYYRSAEPARARSTFRARLAAISTR